MSYANSFVNRKIFETNCHKTLLSCIILITYLIVTKAMFCFGPFYLKDYTMRQEISEQNIYDNVVILHSAVFITDFCYGLSFISTFLSEYVKPCQ